MELDIDTLLAPKKKGATKGKFYSGVPTIRREELKQGSSKKYKSIVNFYDYSGDFGNISHEGKVTFRGGKKPIKMLLDFLNIANLKKNDIVLDFFSGSSSTAHAVLEYNNRNNENIAKYIMVQIPEEFDKDSDYARMGFRNMCELAITRLHNIYEELGQDTLLNKVDAGVRVFDIDSSNMKKIYYSPNEIRQDFLAGLEDNIKEDRTSEDLLFQVMLDMGVLLSSEIKTIDIKGKKVFNVNDGNLVCCFDKNLTDEVVTEIAKMKPLYAVFRDSSMATDSVAVNFDQIFETYSPTTTRKVI